MLIYIIMSIMYMLHIRKEEIIIISQILNPIENVKGEGGVFIIDRSLEQISLTLIIPY